MNLEDKQEIVDLFNQSLDNRERIDSVTHKAHHDQYALDLEKRTIREERWEAVRRQVTGWGIVGLLTAVGTATYKTFFK